MSVDSLKRLHYPRRIAWIDEKNTLPGEFGPPSFDEANMSYMWRVFKRGFTWGNLLKI